jgi:hypothetical protein
MNREKIISIVLVVFAYIVSTGISYALSSLNTGTKNTTSSSPTDTNQTGSQLGFDEGLPKTEPCPLNGEKYSLKQKEWWEKHRPLGVMIENHSEARPQSGLSQADVVYEVVAEGGITRLLALFYCKDAGTIGPIRSARTYFLDFISEYGDSPLYVHVGGANQPGPADALAQITDYDWSGYNDLNQFSIGFPTFWRDYDRLGHEAATEHTMYSTTQKLWEFASLRGLKNIDKSGTPWSEGFVEYSFKDDNPLLEKSQAIHLEFWTGYSNYYVDWTYDSTLNIYKRNSGGKSQVDRNNNQQLTAKNIVVLFMQESNANDGYENNAHLLYKTKGTGKALVFMDGRQILGTWRKDSRTSRTLLFDSNGSPIQFDRGTIWFEILPTNGVINVS